MKMCVCVHMQPKINDFYTTSREISAKNHLERRQLVVNGFGLRDEGSAHLGIEMWWFGNLKINVYKFIVAWLA